MKFCRLTFYIFEKTNVFLHLFLFLSHPHDLIFASVRLFSFTYRIYPYLVCILQVHAPPGGASSFSFGWGSEPAPVVQRTGRRRIDQGGSTVPLSPSKEIGTNSGKHDHFATSRTTHAIHAISSSSSTANTGTSSNTNSHSTSAEVESSMYLFFNVHFKID